MILYSIIKNKLSTSMTAPFLAKTVLDGSISFDQLIKTLAFGSTTTTADVKAVLDNLERVCIESLSLGRSVNLGFCVLRPQVKGSFTSPDGAFSQEKNWIEVSIISNPNFERKISADAKVQRISQTKPSPILLSLENHTSGIPTNLSQNDLLTLHGENLRFDKTDSNQGLFFIENEREERVSEYSKISGKIISFKVPQSLEIGHGYKLELRSNFGQEIRTGELESVLKCS